MLNINIDLAGQLIGVNHAVVSAEESLCHILQFLAAHSGIGLTVRQGIFPSDASSFADVGITAPEQAATPAKILPACSILWLCKKRTTWLWN